MSPLHGCVQVIKNSFFGENRLAFEGVEETSAGNNGIRYHSPFIALIDKIIHFCLKIFGYSRRIIEIQDLDGVYPCQRVKDKEKIYHLNCADLCVWLAANDKNLESKDLKTLNEDELRKLLDNVLKLKSPDVILKIWDAKNKINDKINEKDQYIESNWDCKPCPRKLHKLESELLRLEENYYLLEFERKGVPFPEELIEEKNDNIKERAPDSIPKPKPIVAQADAKVEPTTIAKALPAYALPFCNDPTISADCKALFKMLFVKVMNPDNIKSVQPLDTLVSENGAITQNLHKFNAKHLAADVTNHLGCRGSMHSANPNDPWQTIKITAPNINEPGRTSELLVELKKGLDKHYHLKSGGGGNWQEWIKLPFEEKMKKDKFDPVCFQDNCNGNIMSPQVMLTLIDIKKIIGIIPNDQAYVEALSNAYYNNNFNNDPYAKP